MNARDIAGERKKKKKKKVQLMMVVCVRWYCVGLTALLDAVSWVRSSRAENFLGRGDFPLGVNMGSDSIFPKTLSDESIDQGVVCAYMYSIAWTQKMFMS